MANVNTTTTNRNIFTTIGRNTAAIVAAGTLALGLSGCASGNGRNDDVKPLPTPSQIDKPTTDPTTPATQGPTKGEVNDPSQLECVGQKFITTLDDGYQMVDEENAQAAYDCVKSAGQVNMTSSGPSRTSTNGYKFDSEMNGKIVVFWLADDKEDSNFGTLTANYQG